MLTEKGIKYVRNFIGETCEEVGFQLYITKQAINNVERGISNSPHVRKILTDHLMTKFNELDISDDEIKLRGKLALAGYNCGTEKSKALIKMLEG